MVLPAVTTVATIEASFGAQGMTRVSTANQLLATSGVAKKHGIEQPTGTRAYCNYRKWLKIPNHSLNTEPRRGTEV